MKKCLYLLLTIFFVACAGSNKSEKEFLSVDEFNAYQHLMDSISNIGESYTEPVFMGIKMGQPEKTVVDALFALEREKKISYDGKKFYFTHNFEDVVYRIEIDYDCLKDTLDGLRFEGVNPLATNFEIKMALNDYFKKELVGAKRLQTKGESYKDAVKYNKSLLYSLKENRLSIIDVKLFNRLLNAPDDSGIEDLVFDFEGL